MVKTFNTMYKEFLEEYKDEYPVIYFNKTVITNWEMKEMVEEIKKHLYHLGVRVGVGVGYTLVNGPEIIPLFIAISQLGAYAVPLFSGIPAMPKVSMFANAKVTIVVTNESQVEELCKAANAQGQTFRYVVVEPSKAYYSIAGDCSKEVSFEEYSIEDEEELSLLVASSSGTTGVPKMVSMSQINVGSEMIVSRDMIKKGDTMCGCNEEHRNVANVAFPFSTSVMLVVCGMLFAGTALVYSDDMSPLNFLHNIEYWKCTEMVAPPAYFESLLLFEEKNPYDISTLISVGGGMDFFSPALLYRLKKMFPMLKSYSNGYGLVETCNVYMYTVVDISGDEIDGVSTLTLSESADNIIEVRNEDGQVVVDGEVGEVFVKGPNVVNGYLAKKDEVLEAFKDGWFQTGDIARKENECTVTLLGRRKYFIKRGGKSISPIVVQTQINKVDGVLDSGVVGVPHPLYGEMIWAFVVKDPKKDVSLKDIKKECKKHLAYYMLPDQVTFIDTIPKNPGVGKVNFELLRKLAKDELITLGIQ